MNQKERMLAGLPYKAWMDGLPQEHLDNKKEFMLLINARLRIKHDKKN